MSKSLLQQLLDGGAELSELSRKQLATLSKELAKAGDVRRRDAESFLQSAIANGRDTSERIQREFGRQLAGLDDRFAELERRLDDFVEQFVAIANQIPGVTVVVGGAELAPSDHADASSPGDESPTDEPVAKEPTGKTRSKKPSNTSAAGKKQAAKKQAAKKPATKKPATKKPATRKQAARKTVERTPASKPSATLLASGEENATAKTTARSVSEAVGSSGVRKIATRRPS